MRHTARVFEQNLPLLGNGLSYDGMARLLRQCDKANALEIKRLKEEIKALRAKHKPE